jgi:hypothetical protein
MPSVSPEQVQQDKHEAQIVQEAVKRHPDGVIFYHCTYARGRQSEVQRRLSGALPRRLVIVSDRIYPFPADLGIQLDDVFFCYPLGKNQVLGHVSRAIGVSPASILSYLPKLLSGEDVAIQGGWTVEIAGSDEILTIRNNWPSALPKLAQGLDLIKGYEVSSRLETVFVGSHPDLFLTGCKLDGVTHFYMDEVLYEDLERMGLLDEELVGARKVNHRLVREGGLNIKYVDDCVLVPTLETVDKRLADDLSQLGMRFVALGADQFQIRRQAGVKCRSLDLRWRKGAA